MKRVGILGGAFNPPHAGHLRLAELALEHLALDEVRFMPTATSPHKPTRGPDGSTRFHLLHQALQATGRPFVADDLELARGGVSYTVDTLERLHHSDQDTAWILLLGSDQLPGLTGWRNLRRILELAALALVPRPGFPMCVDAALQTLVRTTWQGEPGVLVTLPGTELDLASSHLRRALALGQEPEGIPAQVRDAIRRESLYRDSLTEEHE